MKNSRSVLDPRHSDRRAALRHDDSSRVRGQDSGNEGVGLSRKTLDRSGQK